MPVHSSIINGAGSLISGGAGLLGGAFNRVFGGDKQREANQNAINTIQGSSNPQNVNTGGAFANFNPDTGMFNTGLQGQALDLQNSLFAQAMQPGGSGQNIFNQGQGLLAQAQPGIDVNALAGQQNTLLQSLLQPQQDRQQGGLLASLLAQGRLGSSGGAGALGELQRVQGLQDTNTAVQALQSAQGAAGLQNQLNQNNFNQGLGLLGFGNQLNQQDIMNSLQAGQGATNLFGLGNQAGALSQGLGGNNFQEAQAIARIQQGNGADPFASFAQGALGGAISSFLPTPKKVP